MAIPPGLAGVVLILLFTGSTLNIMSLMGVIMMTGIVVSNSILIVEFAGILHKQGQPLLEAVVHSCKIRLRPILMTSLATLLGMIPMALGFEAGSEQYAPLARAVIGGLAASVVVTVFLVPAVYLLIHGRQRSRSTQMRRAWNMRKQHEMQRFDQLPFSDLFCRLTFSLTGACLRAHNRNERCQTPPSSHRSQPLVAAGPTSSDDARYRNGYASRQQRRPGQPTTHSSQAEQLRFKNNPSISVARLLALAQAQVTREVRSAEMPTALAPHRCGRA